MHLAPILYAEDNEDDVFFMQVAFERAGIANPLRSVEYGQEVIDYLGGLGRFADRNANPLPCLLLLDLKLPIKTGFEVLEWIRQQPALDSIKVVVVSSSGQQIDMERAKQMGVIDYIRKPSSPQILAEKIRTMKDKWIQCSAS